MALPILAPIAGNLLGGIFGRKSAKRDAHRQNQINRETEERSRQDETRIYERNRADQLGDMESQFQRLRDSAQKGGFNPLSALGTNMVPGIAASGGTTSFGAVAPPLASLDFISNTLKDVGQELSGEAATQREHLRLKNELLTREIEKITTSQAGRISKAPGAAHVGVPNKTAPRNNPDFFSLGETVEELPPTSGPVLTRGKTFFGDLYYPGQDGEPWGIDELLTVAVAAPVNYALRGMKYVRDGVDQWREGLTFPSLTAPPTTSTTELHNPNPKPGWMAEFLKD